VLSSLSFSCCLKLWCSRRYVPHGGMTAQRAIGYLLLLADNFTRN
jgi:hypothetical protein